MSLVGRDAAIGVEADLVIDAKVVALAGHDHVVIAVEPDLAGPAGDTRRERGNSGPLRGLALLAAEGAAHASNLDSDGSVGHAQHMRDDVLQFARMLGRGIDQHVVFAGNGKRHLTFEIEMFLTADLELPSDPQRACGESRRAVAFGEDAIGQNAGIGRQGLVDRDQRRIRVDFDVGEPDGAARGVAAASRDRKYDLAVELDVPIGEHRIVALERTDIVLSGNIARGQHRNHVRGDAYCRKIDRLDAAAGNRRAADGQMERSFRFPDIVDIGCAA